MLCLKSASSGDDEAKEDIRHLKSEMQTDSYLEKVLIKFTRTQEKMLAFFKKKTKSTLLEIQRGNTIKEKLQQR